MKTERRITAKKGIFVGEFSEKDLNSEADRAAVRKKAEETGLRYTNREIVKRGGKMFLRVWVCGLADCEDFK